MRAGGLRKYVIEIQEFVETVSPSGSRVKAWETKIMTRADINFKNGARMLDLHEMVTAYTVEFQVRNYHNIDEKMRILFDGKKYRIEAIMPSYEKQMQTIVTKRINE